MKRFRFLALLLTAMAVGNAVAGPEQERNKQTMIAFQDSWGKPGTEQWFDQFIAKDFVQHSPVHAEGRDAYLKFVKMMEGRGPGATGKKTEYKLVVADKDLVIGFEQQASAVSIHMYRFNKEGLINAHWSFRQPLGAPFVPNPPKNDNGPL